MRTVTKAPPFAARHATPMSSAQDTNQMAISVVEPASVLPEQFFATPASGYQSRGAYVLMRAVLEDAFGCFENQFVRQGQKALRLAREAEEWIGSNDTGWPFAFVNVCAALGLDPDSVRRQVTLRRQGAPRPLRRGRRRVVAARTTLSLAA